MAEEMTRMAGSIVADQHAESNAAGVAKRGTRFSILEEWNIVTIADSGGSLRLCLEGIAFGEGHPLTGISARTSALVRYRTNGRRLVVITRSGSEYMLGLRKKPQDDDKLRLIRYLDRIANAQKGWAGAATTETNILSVGAAKQFVAKS